MLTPLSLTLRAATIEHWACRICGNEWQASIKNRVQLGTGCPVCANTNRKRRPVLTASSSSGMHFWHWQQNAEQGLDPHLIREGSQKRANFVCSCCPKLQPHAWTARISDVFRGTCCPYCSKQRVCECNSLQTLRPDLAAEWCYASNKGTPADYTAKSMAKVWWQNDQRGAWKASINGRFYGTRQCKGDCSAYPP